MPSAVNNHVFGNKRPKLSGSLSGGTSSVIAAIVTSVQNRSGPAIYTVESRPVTVTTLTNIVFGRGWIQELNGVGGIITYLAKIRRDNALTGDIVASASQGVISGNFTFNLSFEELDVSIGAHTYYYTIEIVGTTTVLAPVPFRLYSGGVGWAISVNDTHSTKNNNIIKG